MTREEELLKIMQGDQMVVKKRTIKQLSVAVPDDETLDEVMASGETRPEFLAGRVRAKIEGVKHSKERQAEDHKSVSKMRHTVSHRLRKSNG